MLSKAEVKAYYFLLETSTTAQLEQKLIQLDVTKPMITDVENVKTLEWIRSKLVEELQARKEIAALSMLPHKLQ